MHLSFPGRETADPARPHIIVAVPAQGVMNLADEAQGQFTAARVAGLPEQPEIVTDGECIGPEVTAGALSGRLQPGCSCKVLHECTGQLQVRSADHYVSEIGYWDKKCSPVFTFYRKALTRTPPARSLPGTPPP